MSVLVCSTCDGYEFIETGDHRKQPCPDCAPALVLCPAHGQRVAIDKDGHIIGRCWDCVQESARGIAKIERRA